MKVLEVEKQFLLKATTDEALANCPNVKKCIVVKRTGNYVYWNNDRDVWYHDLIKDVSNYCEPEEMNAEDPFLFFIPLDLLETKRSFTYYWWVYGLCFMTHQYIFNYKPKDIYWCTADIGWVTGHSYIIYGPFLMEQQHNV